MPESESISAATRYRVEVSGWDVDETFFVEKSELEWREHAMKKVLLQHRVADAGIVFVRLLQSTDMTHCHPVAYQAESLATTPDGRFEVRLHPVALSAETGHMIVQ
jgi:hypothetical protein